MTAQSNAARRALLGAATAGLALFSVGVRAQQFPSRPIRIVVGFAAGGPTDVIARLIAAEMTTRLGQSVVVENRPGANSMIATDQVLRAAPDGYTIIASTLAHNINRILAPAQAKYDPIKDFAPISLIATVPMIAVTGYNTPVTSIRELVAQAKAKPGVVNYGSAGHGGSAHLAAAALAVQSGTEMTHVPFKGNAPALTEVIAGRVTFMFYPMIGIADRVAQKQLKPLGVSTATRHPDFPNVPTMSELGFPGFEQNSPGLPYLAPAGTPAPVIATLAEAMRAIVAKPAVRDRLRSLGAVPVGSTPQELAAWLKTDFERWDRLIKAARIQPQ
ncbi:MAG: hypothetical protein RL322_1414 [Pseudomonadota bacterium]|jgi:tripartite-type tricarboxylate transporter receptor subunit TctC